MMRQLVPACVVLMCGATAWAQDGQMTPFDLPVVSNPASRISMAPPAPIAPDSPRVIVEGDQFTVGGKRFRGFGSSINGSICPSNQEAREIAARMAQAGVNCIRFHGIEGAGWWVTPEDQLTPELKAQRDQFDFFVAELARQGVYSNFNLHTYRKYSGELGQPGWGNLHDVILDLFEPELIEAQKNHARRLLEHVNPYRKLRYADDPALAFVEINNENSLFLWNAAELLPKLPEHYMNILQGKFNDFLKQRYASTDKLHEAWGTLDEGESLEDGKVKLFGSAEKPDDRRMVDRMLCLMEVEQAYWDGMYNFVKKDLGYKGLVTGTIVFGPCNLYAQRNMDWIDCHAYWGHPRWEKDVGRWDSVRWTLPRAAMVDSPEKTVTDLDDLSGILFFMAAQQMRDKPFTISEYNHCAPNDYQAECVPILASFAAAQDWDGLWLFTYEYGRKEINWFNLDQNPAKWGFMQAGAAIFRDGGLTALPKTRELSYAEKDNPLDGMIRHQIKRNYDMFTMLVDKYGVKWSDFLDTRLVVNLDGQEKQDAGTAQALTKILWDKSADGKGKYIATGPGGRVWIGHANRLKGENGLSVTAPHFAIVTLTPLDGKPLDECKTALVTAIFRAENTGMKFNEKRDSVGNDWGTLPVLVEPIEGTIAGLPELKGQWTCTALKPDGTAGEQVPVAYDENQLPRIELSAKYKTIWYLLENITPDAASPTPQKNPPATSMPVAKAPPLLKREFHFYCLETNKEFVLSVDDLQKEMNAEANPDGKVLSPYSKKRTGVPMTLCPNCKKYFVPPYFREKKDGEPITPIETNLICPHCNTDVIQWYRNHRKMRAATTQPQSRPAGADKPEMVWHAYCLETNKEFVINPRIVGGREDIDGKMADRGKLRDRKDIDGDLPSPLIMSPFTKKRTAVMMTQCPNCKKYFVPEYLKTMLENRKNKKSEMMPPSMDIKLICPYCKTDILQWYRDHRKKRR